MRRPTLAALTLALAALASAPACDGAARPDPAAETAPAGERYSLYDLPSTWRDQDGAALRLASLAGRPRVVAMVYTNCHATCPLIVADLKRVEASLPAARRDAVGFVLVSLDPERDTPGRLAEWAARTQLEPARWTLLNGDADAVREVAAALGVRYQPEADAEGGGELAHTNVITVLDADGAPVHQQVGLGAAAAGTVDAVRRLLR
ncbi:SCO family protein [Roseisolibacter sp. H3M3-2]|uniref:SCO family protein n=1 Tax=Roseisolibacter sp. H3M3-2 TaxID=3031323 RepID=UPI0023DC0050|nr:SCO family protein [Roseisolibacter sp. H3M3-2]MDF1501377.1 SCO family protein [Roseisolibacter sp. H3M3-2]